MINRIKVARWAVVGGVVLTVGAAAGAATKMKKWSAGDACLCTPDSQDPAGFGTVGRAAANAAPSYLRGGSAAASVRSAAEIGPLDAMLAASGPSFWNTRAVAASSGRAGAVGWSDRVGNVGAYASSSGHRGVGLGGLWRLMSMQGRAAAIKTSAVSTHKAAAASPKRSGGGSRSGSGGNASVPPAAPPLFGNVTTIPGLLGAGGLLPGFGGIGVSGSGGSGGGSGGGGGVGLAATPEPGSIFLLGTGVLGLLGMLRRRGMQ